MKKEIVNPLTSIDPFHIISWVLMLIALAILVVLLIKLFPSLKIVATPSIIRNIIQLITNEKTWERINWLHTKIAEKLKKWWLKIK